MNATEVRAITIQAHGKNELRRVAGNEILNILPQLTKYIGKKISTLNGLAKKFEVEMLGNKQPLIPVFPNHFVSLQNCYLEVKYGDLRLNVTLCFNGGSYKDYSHYCNYFNYTYNLGEVKDDILTVVYDENKVFEMHGITSDKIVIVDDEIQKIEKYRRLKEELQNLRYTIKVPFTEY